MTTQSIDFKSPNLCFLFFFKAGSTVHTHDLYTGEANVRACLERIKGEGQAAAEEQHLRYSSELKLVHMRAYCPICILTYVNTHGSEGGG